MNKKLILFDFDGTVIDNSEGIYKCINYATDKLGFPRLSVQQLYSFIGPSLYDSFTQNCTQNEDEVLKLISCYRERYNVSGYLESVLYPDILSVLKKLNLDGYTVCVVSSKPLPFVTKIVEHLNIKKYFYALCCPDFSQHQSDKDWLIGQAVKKAGVTLEDTVMIGDRHFDIDAAKKAGVESIGVKYGFCQENELENAGADFIVRTAADIYKLITGKNL